MIARTPTAFVAVAAAVVVGTNFSRAMKGKKKKEAKNLMNVILIHDLEKLGLPRAQHWKRMHGRRSKFNLYAP